jgi:sugar lactone lactonase YvrE
LTFTPTPTSTPYQAATLGTGLKNPDAVSVDSTGNIYVADAGNFAIKKYAPTGVLNTAWGKGRGILTVPGSVTVQSLAVDSTGILYAGLNGNNGIYKFDSLGNLIGVYTSANSQTFNNIQGLAVDGSNDLYISDTGNDRIVEMSNAWGYVNSMAASVYGIAYDSGVTSLFGADGSSTVQEYNVASGSFGQSLMTIPGFHQPNDVALDSNGNLYAADTGGKQVVEFALGFFNYPPIVQFTNGGVLTDPVGVAVNNVSGMTTSNYIYVANASTNTVYVFTP